MRRRFFWLIHTVAAVVHMVPLLALASVAPLWLAAAATLSVWGFTLRRMRLTVPDTHQSPWLTRLVDEPLFCHLTGSLFGLVLLPFALLWCWFGSDDWLAASTAAPLQAYLSGLGLAAWGVWGRRRWVVVRRMEIPMPGLPAAFDGYRVVQLSDLHIGSFDPKQRGLRWVERANRESADLCVVTGDLVTSGTAFYRDAAEVIGALQARDGIFVSMGNHDQWDDEAFVRLLQQQGARVLRNESHCLRRGDDVLAIAGIDDAYTKKDDLEKTLSGRPAGASTLLLSHYPGFFRRAARMGVGLTLSGHTHGGQIAVPFVSAWLNVARLSRQEARGLSSIDGRHCYVNAGLGTTGPPVRVGVAPEIAVLVLRSVPPGDASMGTA